MNKRSNRSQGGSDMNSSGWRISDIVRDLAVAWQLMGDPQVSIFLKLSLPLFAFLYWISPIDLLTGMPFDDIAVVVLASRLFVQFAPAPAVERALIRLGRLSRVAPSDQPDRDVWDIWDDDENNTISGEWRVVDDER